MNGSSEKIDTVEVPGLSVRGREGTDIITIVGSAKYWHDKAKVSYKLGFVRGITIGTAFWFVVQLGAKLYKVFHG